MTGILIGGSLLAVIGLGGVFMGLMFVIASGGNSSRLLPGLIFLGAGTGLLILGIRLFVKGLKESPGSLDKAVRAAAAKHNGEISAETLFAEIGNSGAAEIYLEELVRKGSVKKIHQKGVVYYIFPSFQFQLQMKYCPYCSRDYSVRENIEMCPTCGGDLKLQKTGSSKGDDLFSMDS